MIGSGLGDGSSGAGTGATGPTLRNISLSIPKGQLCAVVGPIGSCKSSLLSCLLGEMECSVGYARVAGSISYAAQKPWIFAGSVRENILFHRPYHAERYEQAVRACQLKPDIERLPAGDDTLIGERGVNLSGGQKARVALARAVYSDADVYLFDDPLSAVDVVVGSKIFQHVLSNSGMLAGKTRILVTHQTQFLPQCDNVVVLSQGEVRATGSYQQLKASGAKKFAC